MCEDLPFRKLMMIFFLTLYKRICQTFLLHDTTSVGQHVSYFVDDVRELCGLLEDSVHKHSPTLYNYRMYSHDIAGPGLLT